MRPDRWQQIQALFDEAVEWPASERTAFVRGRAGQDAGLAAEVMALLATYEDDPEYLEGALTDRRDEAHAEPRTDELPGQLLGPWRVGERLGEGGMGVVYRAERADGAFEQSVAIKVVRRGLDTEHLLRRFRSERRILAALDHPDIARPVDAGVVPDGRPYLAMEYVEGERIDAHCRSRELGLEERIDLVLDVCDAVDHAHRRLVVHRDLKPANILVTPEGRVKLLDFGVAKLLDPDDPEAASTLTVADVRPLTPDYASPEQLRGEPVTTAADVYALGVILFELLTGRRPFDRASQPLGELARQLEGAEAPRPSAVAGAFGHRLRGDLDAVVLTALHPDPQRRYESPRALAEDLRRHLRGLAVRAREDSALYRVRRFVGRHRASVGVAGAFLAMLVVASLLLVRQVDRTTRQRDHAERERARAEQVVSLLIDLFRTSDPTVVPGGDQIPVSAFLERAGRDVETLREQPDVQVRAWAALAGIHAARSRYPEADSLLTRARSRLDEVDPPDPRLRAAVHHQQAILWSMMGRTEEARAALRASLEFYRQEFGAGHLDYARVLQDLAAALDAGQERKELFEQSLAIHERYAESHPRALASILNAYANDRVQVGELETASALYARAEQLLARILDPDHPHLLVVRKNLASLRSRLGDHVQAETSLRLLLASRIRVLGPRTIDVAGTRSGLGVALAQQGRYEEAEAEFEHAAQLYEELLGDAHRRVALEWRNVARARELQAAWEPAIEAFERSCRISERAAGPDDPLVGWYHASSVASLLAVHRLDAAQAAAARALELCVDRDSGASTERAAEALRAAARVAEHRGDFERAQLQLRRSFKLRAETLAEDDPRLADSACALGAHLLEHAGDADAAWPLLERHLPRLEAWKLALPADVARARLALSRATAERRP